MTYAYIVLTTSIFDGSCCHSYMSLIQGEGYNQIYNIKDFMSMWFILRSFLNLYFVVLILLLLCVLIQNLVLLGFALHIHKITFCLRFIFASAFSLVVKLYDVRNPWIGPPGTPTIQDLRFLIFHKARLPKQRVVSYSFSLFHLCYTI